MEENQNANEQLQPGEVIPEAQESSEPSTPETSMPASEEAKEETPTSPQTTDGQLQTTEMEVHKHPHHPVHQKNGENIFCSKEESGQQRKRLQTWRANKIVGVIH